jgi:hypothetical protein
MDRRWGSRLKKQNPISLEKWGLGSFFFSASKRKPIRNLSWIRFYFEVSDYAFPSLPAMVGLASIILEKSLEIKIFKRSARGT